MRAEYDFTSDVRNPYTRKEKKAVTIRLETDVVDSFKGMSIETGIPCQTLISRYLRDCAGQSRKLRLAWNRKEKCAEHALRTSPGLRPVVV